MSLTVHITKMSDTSITVIYHAISLTVHITKMSDMSSTVIYHAMSLTVHITKMSDTSISDLSCYVSNCPYHQDE
jgi:hypothetical protein